jgi:hypothetical protein
VGNVSGSGFFVWVVGLLGNADVTFENLHKRVWALRRVTGQEKIAQATRETLPFLINLPDERQRILLSECVPEVRLL